MRINSRRAFLGAAGAAAVLPKFSWAAAARDRSRRLKLGLASYSMRKFTLDQTLDCGMSQRTRERRVESGEWDRLLVRRLVSPSSFSFAEHTGQGRKQIVTIPKKAGI